MEDREHPKISVIVPVYNAEKSLPRCIDSILAQTISDFELLLVDDGSTDRSGAICREYADKDSRVKVLTKRNGGVGSARNLGLDNACGEWITFVDSDDWATEDYFARFYPTEDCDIIIQSFLVNGKPTEDSIDDLSDHVYSDMHGFADNAMFQSFCMLAPWVKLFRREIIERIHLRFDERFSSGEDSVFVLSYVAEIKTARTVDAKCYNYVRDCSSSLSVRGLPVTEILTFLEAYYTAMQCLEKCGYMESADKFFIRVSFGFIRRCRMWIVAQPISLWKKSRLFKQLYSHRLVRKEAETQTTGNGRWNMLLVRLHLWLPMTVMCVWRNRKHLCDIS